MVATVTKRRNKQKTLRQLCRGKPSVALQAMCDGLRAASKRPSFIIAMWSYGHASKQFCYGCAATCTLQEIAGVEFTPKRLRVSRRMTISFRRQAQLCNLGVNDVMDFEGAMESARCGNLIPLYDFFGVTSEKHICPDRRNERWLLADYSWREELPKVRAFIRKLEKIGL